MGGALVGVVVVVGAYQFNLMKLLRFGRLMTISIFSVGQRLRKWHADLGLIFPTTSKARSIEFIRHCQRSQAVVKRDVRRRTVELIRPELAQPTYPSRVAMGENCPRKANDSRTHTHTKFTAVNIHPDTVSCTKRRCDDAMGTQRQVVLQPRDSSRSKDMLEVAVSASKARRYLKR